MAIKERLDAIKSELSEISISGTFPSCSAADRVFEKLTRIASDANKRIKKGDGIEGFAIVLKVYLKGKALCSKADTSSGAWMYTDAEAIEAMEAAVSAATCDDERDYIFSELLKATTRKEAYDWDGDFELLRIAARLVTIKNNQLWLKKLDEVKAAHNKEQYSCWENSNETILMAEYLSYFEPASYKAYLDNHLDIDSIRRSRIELAIESGEYDLAEKLCLEKYKKERDYSPDTWAELIINLYKKSNQTEKLLAFFDELIFASSYFHKLNIYKEIKMLYLVKESWADKYEYILERAQKENKRLYITILEEEKDWERYIEALQSSPQDIYKSGKKFVKEYPKQVYDLFRLAILQDAENANVRTHYYWLAKHLRELEKFGGEIEAEEIRAELTKLYPKRPAMLDELETARLGRRSTAWDNRRRW